MVFVGTVRDRDGGRTVTQLGYEAHPSVDAVLRSVAAKSWPAIPCALAAVHRVGELAIGDIAVVVAVSCPHRGEAFDACRQLIDDLKTSAPIWKHQRFTDGTDEWVGSRDVVSDAVPWPGRICRELGDARRRFRGPGTEEARRKDVAMSAIAWWGIPIGATLLAMLWVTWRTRPRHPRVRGSRWRSTPDSVPR